MDYLKQLVPEKYLEHLFSAGLKIGLILVLALLSWGFLRILLSRFRKRLENRRQSGKSSLEDFKRAETLSNLLRKGLKILVFVITAMMILREVGVQIGPLIAGAGIAGLAIGFGAQSLVKDIITGFFILLEDQIRVGDVAIINGTPGAVEAINFRTVILRDLEGVVHIFPNGNINTIANRTKGWSAYVITIGVAYKEDTDKCVAVMQQVGNELYQAPEFGPLMLESIEIYGVDAFADSAVNIKARIRTKAGEQWLVGREYLRRLKKAFDREKIEIPFPHISLYAGENSSPIKVKND